jgi:NAD+ synthase (glutamine-hydrolysing)
MKTLRLALCQINPVVGDIDGNLSKILSFTEKAVNENSEIIVFPELALTGFIPEDLLLYSAFINKSRQVLEIIANKVDNFVVVGLPFREKDLYNSAVILAKQKIIDVYHKIHCSVDEMRYFNSGNRIPLYEYDGVFLGINIGDEKSYMNILPSIQVYQKAELIINISASSFCIGKFERKLRRLTTLAYEMGVFIAYLNLVGGQDEIVFDGRSLVISPYGEVIAIGKAFEEDLLVVDIDLEDVNKARSRKPKIRWDINVENIEIIKIPLKKEQAFNKPSQLAQSFHYLTEEEEIFKALITGLRDYLDKNGFKKVCLGLSGGIDSSFVALLATEAVGKDRVVGVFMPSRYTSRESKEDVYELSKNLGIKLIEVPIDDIFEEYIKGLLEVFEGLPQDVTEENIQSRIRANILMAVSNKFGWLVLTTGNKSEMAVGYTTLYGDMAGGFSVIKDVYKTQLYKLARWAGHGRIPERVFHKPPSAELRLNQTDQDTLPPYEVLDEILKRHIEKCMSEEEIVEQGFDREIVKKVLGMVKKAEFKRRQAPLGIKISSVSFGKDWRFPITNRFVG